MYIVTGGRRSGKTATTIRWLLEDPQNRVVIVINSDRRQEFIRLLKDLIPNHDWRPHVITATDAPIQGNMRGHDRGMGRYHHYCIDDLDIFLEMLFRSKVEFATANATWIPLSSPEPAIKAEVVSDKMIGDVVDNPHLKIGQK